MRGFSDLYVFRSFEPQNQTESHRIRRDLSNRQENAQLFWSELQVEHIRQKRDLNFNDPFYAEQWELNGKEGNYSMKIPEAWAEGYTGNGVVVSILVS